METATRLESSVRFGTFELDLHTHELYRDGTRLKIRGHPVDVLAILLEHPGEVVSRETLRKRLWPDNTFVDFEQILNNSIGKLREALGDHAESPNFIETLPRLGYRFIARLQKPMNIQMAQAPSPPEAQPRVPSATIKTGHTRITSSLVVWMVVALGVVAFAVFGYWYLRRSLPAPLITDYKQLTLDGRQKIVCGTDGVRIYIDVLGPRPNTGQILISGGKVTEIPIDLPPGSAPWFCSGVSPDGTSLLVMNNYSHEDGYMLWLVGIAGHPARYITRAFASAWSPDGKMVVYANRHGDVYTIGINGGEPRLLYGENASITQLTRTRDISWSPDGATIRFTRWGGKIFEISSAGAKFHEWLPSWNGSVQKCCGSWTPDGRFFLFLAGRSLEKGPTFRPLAQIWAVDERQRTMRPRIAEPVLLASDPLLWGNPVPSRDSGKIYARGVSLRGELERYDHTTKRLEPYLGGISAEMPDFSRDGRYVAYVSFPDGILWRANRDGSEVMQLTEPPLYPRNPRWSPDARNILFTANAQNGVDAIYVVSSQGGTPTPLLPDDRRPQSLADWSPDGMKVVYTTDPGLSFVPAVDPSNVETRIVELATGNVTILPKRSGGFYAPLWSPDGRYIAGQGRYIAWFDERELVAFDLKTGKWNTLVPKEAINYHSWSHDGRFIYFVRWIQGKGGVYRIRAQGGKEELIFAFPQGFRGTGWYDFWMSLDPDDSPLFLRDAGTDEIYALTLDRK